MLSVLQQVDYVLVPVVNEFKDVHTAVNFIQEIEIYNSNILIIANKTGKGDFESIKKTMQKFYPKYPVFEIKRSRAMPNIMKEKKSIKAMIGEGGLKAYNYKVIDEQFDEILKVLK